MLFAPETKTTFSRFALKREECRSQHKCKKINKTRQAQTKYIQPEDGIMSFKSFITGFAFLSVPVGSSKNANYASVSV
jgi:hypothetical protein